MDIYILASGSKGNMTYLKTDDMRLFIDVGISYSKIKSKMADYEENIYDVKTIILTHEHSDHTIGLKMLLKYGAIEDIYLTKGTFDALPADIVKDDVNFHIVSADTPFNIGELKLTPFMISHDASEPVGYVIENHVKKMVVLTDSGYVDESYMDLLKNADLYILEANHDPNKLMQSPRPFPLKRRILGERGHLSNEDACILMNKLVQIEKSIWVVAHISEDCNTILDIEEAIVKYFDDPTKIEVYYTDQNGLPVISL